MKLHTKIVIALAAGAGAGILANALLADAAWLKWTTRVVLVPTGQVFLRLLLMVVVPLVFASLILGVARIGDVGKLGRIGGRTLAYFLATTTLAVLLGIGLVNLVEPGAGMDAGTRTLLLETFAADTGAKLATPPTAFGVDMLVNIVPRNPVQAAATMDMLGIIFFALAFGIALGMLPAERAAPMLDLMQSIADVTVKIIEITMRFAPVGVFALVFVAMYRFGWHLLEQLGVYIAVVLFGLLLHAGVTLSLAVRLLGRLSPAVFWRRARASLVTAFSTSSSNATLPTNMTVAREQFGVSGPIAGFVLPLGATMNMNGTALFEGVTVLFLAQVFGVELTLGQQLVVVVLAVVTAVGAAGVPGGSLPLMTIVLAAIGVPGEAIGVIIGVDRILDMCRTTVNVAGDLSAAVYLERREAADLREAARTAPAA